MKKIIIIVLLSIVVASYFLVQRDEVAVPDSGGNVVSAEVVPFTVFPVSHASFVSTLGEVVIYNDPVGEAALFQKNGPATIMLLSDVHGDHLSTSTISALLSPKTTIVAPQAVFDLLTPEQKAQTKVLKNDEEAQIAGINIKAVPMYNLPESEDSRHEKGRGNGYILTSGQTDVYIAGDTADIPEMRALTSIDYAFIPMNLPYTMSVETAADAVIAFAPKVVYPYHYRTPEGKSDVARFKTLVNEGNPAITVELLPWYEAEPMQAEPAPVTTGAKLDIKAVCEGALAYTDFINGEAAAAFVADCVAGKHREVIERHIKSLGVDGAVI